MAPRPTCAQNTAVACITLALLGLCVRTPAFGADPTAPQTALTVTPRAVDFGRVARHCHGERALCVANRSDQPVRLGGSGSDCTCLTNSIDAEVLEPGVATQWRVRLDACEYVGEVRRHVWLEIDDPTDRRLKVPVRYEVVPDVFCEPSLVSLGLIVSEAVEAEVSVKTLSDQPIEVLAARCTDPAVAVDLQDEVVTRARLARLRIRLATPLPEGPYTSIVWLETTSPEVPRLRVALRGESITGLDCDRREVVFDAVPLGTCQTQRVTLVQDTDVHVGGVRTTNEAVEVEAVQRGGNRVVVTLRSSSKLALGRFQGQLILEVNGRLARKVKLPYRGQVVME